MERHEVIYRLDGINPEDGVDVCKLVPYLSEFDKLIKETAKETGYSGDVSVKVRPFKEGSFITEFVVNGGLTDLLSGPEVTALSNVLGILGFFGVSAAAIPKVIKVVRGKVTDFHHNKDGTYSYGTGGDAVTVDETTHRVIQSPKVADSYKTIAVGPISEFSGVVEQVNIYVPDRDSEDGGMSNGASFNIQDVQNYSEYVRDTEMAAESSQLEKVSIYEDIWLRPLSGSYGGAETGYTFSTGEGDDMIRYKNVKMDDASFRKRLENGAVRMNSSDLLKVNLEIEQHITGENKVRTTYRITKVLDYKSFGGQERLFL